MKDTQHLAQLFAAERAESPPATDVARGWHDLKSALQAGVPAPAIAHGPLKLGLSVATKSLLGSGLLAFTVTTASLGIHAAVTRPVAVTAPSAVSVGSAETTVSAVRLPSPQQLQVRPQEPTLPTSAPQPGPQTLGTREAPTLQEELRLIKAAKQELDAGRSHLASVWLDEHAARFPRGVLRREREELRGRLAALPAENRERSEPNAK